MLVIVKSINELDKEQFLSVYAQSIRENGLKYYPKLSDEQQRFYAGDDLIAYMRDDFFRQRDAFCAVWLADGVYKCALRIEPFRDGVLLHALETALDARRKGYAYKLIISVLEYLKQNRCISVYSHVHKRNVPSLRLHKKCGFQQISDSAVYIDGTVTQNSCTMLLQL